MQHLVDSPVSKSFVTLGRSACGLKPESRQRGDALQKVEVELGVRRGGGSDRFHDYIGGRVVILPAMLGEVGDDPKSGVQALFSGLFQRFV